MLANQRREKILNLIQEDGQAKVQDLSRIFKVTEVTIRQDLERLEKEGLIEREHGGAFLRNMHSNVASIALQNQNNLSAKIVIAHKAVSFIEDSDVIILDSGSTTTEIARLIKGFKNLTVITNALNIALMLGAEPGINLIMTGGEFKHPTLSLTGRKAADFFVGIHADKLFLATAGISPKAGLTYPSINDICVKSAMIDCANEVYLVADSSKIGINSFASLGALSLIGHIITDNKITQEQIKMLNKHNINCIISEDK